MGQCPTPDRRVEEDEMLAGPFVPNALQNPPDNRRELDDTADTGSGQLQRRDP